MQLTQTKSKIIMAGLLTFMLSLICSYTIQAQQKIKASDIMKDVKDGKTISYEGVTITGILDFTFMDEKMPNLDTKHKWWKNGGSNSIDETIDNKISFINCMFEDNVLAYYHDDRSEYTFKADFERPVTFENCVFKDNAMFKYSTFEAPVNFKGSSFQEETTFKYAEFEDDSDFSNTIFDEEATFKYAEFRNKANFSNTAFDRDAIFKYSNFRDGVNFTSAAFNRSLDLKYTKVRGDFDIDKMKVRGDIDSKYTSINGSSFSKYIWNNRD